MENSHLNGGDDGICVTFLLMIFQSLEETPARQSVDDAESSVGSSSPGMP